LTAYDRSKAPAAAVKAASDAVIFSHVVLRLLTTHSGIVSVSVENDVFGLTLVAAKVLLDKIHWIHLDNFSV